MSWDFSLKTTELTLNINYMYLLLKSIEVVVVDVRVAQRVHELACGQSRDVGDHVREERVAEGKSYHTST